MTARFFALLTNIGAAKLANATALGTRLEITQMAVGDGGGTLPTPNPAQTKLVNEQRRAALNMLSIDPINTSQIIAEQVIPETEGGWWIREIGLLDKDGDLVAIANCAETYKPQLQEGSGRTQTIRMILIVSSTAAVTLKIDPSVVLATRKYVDDKVIEVKQYADNLLTEHEKSRNHPNASLVAKGFAQYSSATDSNSEALAATSKAVKDAKGQAIQAASEYNRVVNAFQVHPPLEGINLNTLGAKAVGIHYQYDDPRSTLENNYPITLAGTLVILPSAYGAQQEYTPYTTGQKFVRNILGEWNGTDGPWTPWALIGNNVAPVGIPMPWPTSTPPAGWLKCNGSPFNKAQFPQLALAYPSGYLPDLRGEFMRGWDDGRGVDVGRGLLTAQTATSIQPNIENSPSGTAVVIDNPDGSWNNGATGGVSGINYTSNGGSRIRYYSRPRNMAFNYIVRAA
ncbi:phage tail protein [Yersinia aldovae]|uniref:phage tail protein n=1 Tax=Yersinia aldovae TaxID=29483 RepID=UPI0011AABE5B|nr:phage tail protein [Yersinia aldovae]